MQRLGTLTWNLHVLSFWHHPFTCIIYDRCLRLPYWTSFRWSHQRFPTPVFAGLHITFGSPQNHYRNLCRLSFHLFLQYNIWETDNFSTVVRIQAKLWRCQVVVAERIWSESRRERLLGFCGLADSQIIQRLLTGRSQWSWHVGWTQNNVHVDIFECIWGLDYRDWLRKLFCDWNNYSKSGKICINWLCLKGGVINWVQIMLYEELGNDYVKADTKCPKPSDLWSLFPQIVFKKKVTIKKNGTLTTLFAEITFYSTFRACSCEKIIWYTNIWLNVQKF